MGEVVDQRGQAKSHKLPCSGAKEKYWKNQNIVMSVGAWPKSLPLNMLLLRGMITT